jgi:hypothetical protein
MLPCSIRLSCREHRFELAAACQREKDLWLRSLQKAQDQTDVWLNEPTSSLRLDDRGELIPSTLDDGPFEMVNALPTIQSIPELARSPSTDIPDPMSSVKYDMRQKSPKVDTMPLRREAEPPSRRSSTASVKAIFTSSPVEPDTIVIRRSSASARLRVDQGLQDVISQPCLEARSHAFIQDEELFQGPKTVRRSSFVRSQSGLSVASLAKGRLARHESFRVVRRKSILEGGESATKRPSSVAAMSPLPSPRRLSRNLQLTALPSNSSRTSPTNTSASPSSSFLSGSIYSLHTSMGNIPTQTVSESGHSSSHLTAANLPIKTSRSLVSNVREFFSSRSSSTTSFSHSSSSASGSSPKEKPRKQGTPNKLRKPSVHRRAQSAPDTPEPSMSLPMIEKLPPLDLGGSISVSPQSRIATLPRRSLDRASAPKMVPSPTIRFTPSQMEPERGNNPRFSLLQCMPA